MLAKAKCQTIYEAAQARCDRARSRSQFAHVRWSVGNPPCQACRRWARVRRETERLQKLYDEVEAPAKLQRWLNRHPGVAKILVAAAPELRRRFPSDALALRLGDRDGPKYFLAVRSSREVDDAQARLSKFIRQWWLQRVDYPEYRVVVTVDYV